jgi:hypothetical protein
VKVTSPIGDFPFEPSRLRLKDGALVMEGAMGAWPATVRVEPADVPVLLRLIPAPLLALLGALGVALLWNALGRSRP